MRRLDGPAANVPAQIYLAASQLADQPTPMPWLGGKLLRIRFA